MTDNQTYPGVGFGVMIFKDGKVLVGRRKSALGHGFYAWPGGKIHYMETFEDAIRREVREETGLEIKNIRFLRLYNFKENDDHFVDLGFTADWAVGEPQLLEPDKCEGWDWYDLNDLPEPLWKMEFISIDALKTGRTFYDA